MSDPAPSGTGLGADSSAPVRAAVRMGALGAVALAVAAAAIGGLVRGAPGLWGALLGAGITAVFVLFTAAAVLLTRNLEPTLSGAVLLGSWLAKLLLLVVVLALLRGREFYDAPTLFVVVVVGTAGLLGLETAAVVRTRVPYVDPAPGPGSPGWDEHGRDAD